MKKPSTSLYVLIVISIVSSCQEDNPTPKDSNSDQNGTLSGVYVSGINGPGVGVAAYWKDGVVTNLLSDRSIASSANAITVSESDVYAAGFEGSVAKYWKNGTPVTLTDGKNEAAAASIVVSGSDIYIGGYEYNGSQKQVAKIWKNGIASALSDGTTMANVFQAVVSGGNVYAAGVDQVGLINPTTFNPTYQAKYWKNGVGVPLTDGTRNSAASSIFVSGTDVYVAGYQNNAGGEAVATVWKNGVANELTDGTLRGYASSIYVSDGDVHVVGFERNGESGMTTVKYWKNSTETILTQASYAFAQTVVVNGTDVYILYFDGTNYILLKNGSKVAPFDGANPQIIAHALFVKQ